MYEIKSTSDGGRIGLTDAPYYISRAANGCFVPSPEHDAQGICFAGTVYNLLDRPPMDGVETTVVVETVDAGRLLAESETAILDATELAVDLKYRLTLMELGITDDGTSIT